MKETIIIVVVLALTFIPNVIFRNLLTETGNELIEIIDDMKKDFESESAGNKEKSQNLKSTFLVLEKKWILIVDHEILDEVENTIEECVAFYNADDEMEFDSSSQKLKNHIEDLAKREETTLNNIL